MEAYKSQIILSSIVLVSLLIVRFITTHSINKALKKFHFSLQRRRITIKVLNLFLAIGAFVALFAIWGIEKEKILLFVSSVLTILGIAFFAQWSLLSNITAGLILYFNHPMKLGDNIKVLEKDFIIEGIIDDITFFFVHINTLNGEEVTIPNSIILQKNISVKRVKEKTLVKGGSSKSIRKK
jgi:small-conductance mechanosensitive channel